MILTKINKMTKFNYKNNSYNNNQRKISNKLFRTNNKMILKFYNKYYKLKKLMKKPRQQKILVVQVKKKNQTIFRNMSHKLLKLLLIIHPLKKIFLNEKIINQITNISQILQKI